MKNDLVTFEKLTVEARTEVILEAAEESAWAIEKTEEKIARLAELLKQQKAALGHGKWLPWIRKTFGDTDAAVWKVQRWLRSGRSNNAPAHYLELGDEQKTVPRSARKTGQVKVTTPPDDPDDVGTVDDYPPGDFDVDPTPDPPTIRKTAAGSKKVKESEKPKTRPVVAEIVEEPEQSPEMRIKFAVRELSQVLSQIDVSERKKTAKQLRKLADELDPPTKFRKPDLEEVSAYFAEQMAQDPDSFFDFYESKGWLVGKVSMKDWRASARKWIRENKSNGKVNGNNGHLSREQQREQNNANSIGYLVKLKREQEQQRRIASGD